MNLRNRRNVCVCMRERERAQMNVAQLVKKCVCVYERERAQMNVAQLVRLSTGDQIVMCSMTSSEIRDIYMV